MHETQSDQSQQPLDLTLFAKEQLFSDDVTFDLEKKLNDESYFEPIPNGFYGFCIPIPETGWYNDGIPAVDTVDIDFEDVTHKKIA